jgi:hypothetical protein
LRGGLGKRGKGYHQIPSFLPTIRIGLISTYPLQKEIPGKIINLQSKYLSHIYKQSAARKILEEDSSLIKADRSSPLLS